MEYDQLQKYVSAFLHVLSSTETFRDIGDVLRGAHVPEDDAAEVLAYLEREQEPLIARPDKAPRLVTLTHWGKEWSPRKQ